MHDELVNKANEVLENPEKLKKFAEMNKLAIDAARKILNKLIEDPKISEKIEEYIFSDDSDPRLKDYYAGEEKGYKRGHDAGWGKGLATGVLGTLGALAIAGITLFKIKDK